MQNTKYHTNNINIKYTNQLGRKAFIWKSLVSDTKSSSYNLVKLK